MTRLTFGKRSEAFCLKLLVRNEKVISRNLDRSEITAAVRTSVKNRRKKILHNSAENGKMEKPTTE